MWSWVEIVSSAVVSNVNLYVKPVVYSMVISDFPQPWDWSEVTLGGQGGSQGSDRRSLTTSSNFNLQGTQTDWGLNLPTGNTSGKRMEEDVCALRVRKYCMCNKRKKQVCIYSRCMWVCVCVFPEARQRREVQPSYYKTANYGSPQPEISSAGASSTAEWRLHSKNQNASTLEKCCNLKSIAPYFKETLRQKQKDFFVY